MASTRIEDTGPLTKKRMEVADAEFLAAAENFVSRAHQANKPLRRMADAAPQAPPSR
jgi:hypothetical protein